MWNIVLSMSKLSNTTDNWTGGWEPVSGQTADITLAFNWFARPWDWTIWLSSLFLIALVGASHPRHSAPIQHNYPHKYIFTLFCAVPVPGHQTCIADVNTRARDKPSRRFTVPRESNHLLLLSQLRIYQDTILNGHLNTVSRREIGSIGTQTQRK